MKLLILVFALSFAHTVHAEDDSDNGPAEASESSSALPGVMNINFDLAEVKKPAPDIIRNSIRDYLREHPGCAEQRYRYCEVYLPSAPASGNVECEDGYTFYSNDVIGLNIDRRSSPPKPAGMTGTQLEDLVRTRRSHATLIGVCRKI